MTATTKTGRFNLLLAVIMTICGAAAVAVAPLIGHATFGTYSWPVTSVIWCWCWYGATRANRRLMGGAR